MGIDNVKLGGGGGAKVPGMQPELFLKGRCQYKFITMVRRDFNLFSRSSSGFKTHFHYYSALYAHHRLQLFRERFRYIASEPLIFIILKCCQNLGG